jgi:hypothetical protein
VKSAGLACKPVQRGGVVPAGLVAPPGAVAVPVPVPGVVVPAPGEAVPGRPSVSLPESVRPVSSGVVEVPSGWVPLGIVVSGEVVPGAVDVDPVRRPLRLYVRSRCDRRCASVCWSVGLVVGAVVVGVVLWPGAEALGWVWLVDELVVLCADAAAGNASAPAKRR